jgi:hypothetical protein
MTDGTILEEGKIYKIKPPMMNQSALYQLSRYAYDNDLRFGQALFAVVPPHFAPDLFFIEDAELERRIKDFISALKE